MIMVRAQIRRRRARNNSAANLPGLLLAAATILIAYSVISTQNVTWEFGRSREVTVSVTRLGDPACAELWWVKMLGGGIEPVGVVCGTRALRAPSNVGELSWSVLRGSVVPGVRMTAVQGREIASVGKR